MKPRNVLAITATLIVEEISMPWIRLRSFLNLKTNPLHKHNKLKKTGTTQETDPMDILFSISLN